jgi:hypothetical protein
MMLMIWSEERVVEVSKSLELVERLRESGGFVLLPDRVDADALRSSAED